MGAYFPASFPRPNLLTKRNDDDSLQSAECSVLHRHIESSWKNPVRWSWLVFSFYRLGNWGSQWLGDSSWGDRLSGRAESKTSVSPSRVLTLCCLIFTKISAAPRVLWKHVLSAGNSHRPWAGTWFLPTKAEWEQRNRATSWPSPARGSGGSERKHPESGLPATELGQRSCVLGQQRSSFLCELSA